MANFPAIYVSLHIWQNCAMHPRLHFANKKINDNFEQNNINYGALKPH